MEKEILKNLKEKVNKAYTPYSNFKVAAAVLADNKVYYGVNVENSSYPLTICAEANAITTAVTNGMKKIDKIYVIGQVKEPISPCGACRQIIKEFSTDKTEIILLNNSADKKIIYSISKILPYGFEF